MTLLEAKYVTLAGNLTVSGMNTRNFDAVRDECVLHLHQETGGVFVSRGSDSFYISPVAVQSVELTAPLNYEGHQKPSPSATRTVSVPKAMLTPTSAPQYKYPVLSEEEANAERARVAEKGARNLADEVLAELNDKPDEKPLAHQRRLYKNAKKS